MVADFLTAHFRGELSAVGVRPDLGQFVTPKPLALLPGSFNPLHAGHLELAAVAERVLGVPVAFELSTQNVDKPPLDEAEVRRRLRQFTAPVWVTTAATVIRKAELFPGAAFVLGFDTAIRLVDPKYYGHDAGRRDAVLQSLMSAGSRVVVGGRLTNGRFEVWDPDAVGRRFAELFLPLAEADFRVDVSSTSLRGG